MSEWWVTLLACLFLELLYKTETQSWQLQDLIVLILFVTSFTLLVTLFGRIMPRGLAKFWHFLIMLILTLVAFGQWLFFEIFQMPFSFSSIGLANQAADFAELVIPILQQNLHTVALLWLPFMFYVLVYPFLHYRRQNLREILAICILSVFLLACDVLVFYRNLYFFQDDLSGNFRQLGIYHATALDVFRVVSGFEGSLIHVDNTQEPEPPVINARVMDFDFFTLIANESDSEIITLHEYFLNRAPTSTNQYTGLFKDKNLIFIVAEGFNEIAIDPVLTPTLYQMSHSSFIFENFYSSHFLSTIGGEFQALTGLLPTQTLLNNWSLLQPIFPFSMGFSFGNQGYITKSFHNWTYTYYHRNTNRPTLGFGEGDYIGCGNGLETMMDCTVWPPSDVEMIQAIFPLIAGDGQKHATYILTVSGHAPYSQGGNAQTAKNWALVENLPYSDEVKGYLAAQIELDRMLETLLIQLEASGELDNTVIALVGDHYPYMMSIDEINELSSYPRDEVFTANKSAFILYNPQVETTVVTKVGSQIDVLPTLLNLFDIPYDSRLILGHDIFSEAEGLAIFSNRSFISDLGTYDAKSGEFTPVEGVEVPEGYVAQKKQEVDEIFTVSSLLVKHDYYKILFPDYQIP
jgi:phosphoglycerol transferase MdoB-like AlkP superfamily enzyme